MYQIYSKINHFCFKNSSINILTLVQSFIVLSNLYLLKRGNLIEIPSSSKSFKGGYVGDFDIVSYVISHTSLGSIQKSGLAFIGTTFSWGLSELNV